MNSQLIPRIEWKRGRVINAVLPAEYLRYLMDECGYIKTDPGELQAFFYQSIVYDKSANRRAFSCR